MSNWHFTDISSLCCSSLHVRVFRGILTREALRTNTRVTHCLARFCRYPVRLHKQFITQRESRAGQGI